MSIVKNGTPQSVNYGVDDQSVPDLVPVAAGKPIHLPLCFTFSPKGDPSQAYVVSGDQAETMYGDIFDVKSDYTTFNTPFIKMFNEAANEMLVQRVVPTDAKSASLRLYAEVVTATVPIYERSIDNSIVYGSDGLPKTTGTKDGIKIVWRFGTFGETAGEFKQGKTFDGTLTGIDNKVSTIYPIMDFAAPYVGGKVNDFGIRLWCPNSKSTNALNPDIVDEVKARIMTIQFVDLLTEGTTPSITRTLDGATDASFSFMSGAYYESMRLDLDIDEVILPSYRNMNPDAGYAPTLGPISDLHVYDANLEAVLKLAQAAIADADLTNHHMVDIFTGLDVYGNAYNGLTVDDGTEGGELLTDTHVHYLSGGSDGTMTNETFDLLVRNEMLQFGEGSVNYWNVLKYPSSALWDAGYSTDTKDALTNYIATLKNTNVFLCTHVWDQGSNSMQVEESMKVALAAMLRAHPESSKYGTPAMRGHVIGHSMLLNNSQYRERVPVSYSLARMIAKYSGAGDGYFKSQYKFSRGELAVITDGYDINLTYKPFTTYMSDWDNGLVSVRSFDQYQYHFPALYTVYDEDRSICNNMLVAIIIADLEYLTIQTWSEMSGVSDMTDAQIVKMVNAKLIAKTTGRYDGVVTIVPNAYFTEADKSNGYSITVDIDLYGAVMKTVFKQTIIAHRYEDA